METHIRIAIQKSGRLHDASMKLLKDCNIAIDNGRDQLKSVASNFPMELLHLRNSDIPRYVESGVADIGITGENLLRENAWKVEKRIRLGFSRCRLSIAAPRHIHIEAPGDLEGLRIATSYPNTLEAFLKEHRVQCAIHPIAGSVEIAPNIGLADAICDLVSSGNTLFKNNLEEKLILFKSEACLIANPDLGQEKLSILDKLRFRLKAVLTSKQNKYILMNAPNDALGEIIRILPGMKSPTVMPLAAEGWSSVHTVIQEEQFWDIIDKLKSAGAEGILVVPIEKMIL